ncbi:radical SAM protein [Oceanirhabdus seepicola]|uniref:B12-binding domain-containing radical SAM protein n=1 Tax=Oceanirhabdus seepicola TaxID=2828781 RepID=A0A9J6P582_9CLOT|nr:radical SAM protein [Oceanirhabdus seepicola]MCM1990949.1 B12-binding domain-containing radical SAM protein [Oceanirhabdus seepicola]
MKYEGVVYRPPSEARSLIIQVTIGCSHNKCTFCAMYKEKKFKIKDINLIKEELREARNLYRSVRRIFLADGDAFILKTSELIEILLEIKDLFPECERVSSYATPRDIINKSNEDIRMIREHGLEMLYMGIESGSDEILKIINKGVTAQEIINAGKKAIECGMKLSATLISGIGGVDKWRDHAVESARVISEINPHYVGLLTLMVEEGTELHMRISRGEMVLLQPQQVIAETYEFINNLEVSECIFRSNHASNYVPLGGTLNRDKEKILQVLKQYMNGEGYFKDEQYRSL